jgi:murein DD-endopeptidase MepM/ murein hydrolase activator NlpD
VTKRGSLSADPRAQGTLRAGRRLPVATALAAGLLTAAATPAAGAGPPGGGTTYVPRPQVSKVSCLRRCASHHRAQAGSTLKLTGYGLGQSRQVVFLGSYGRADDVSVPVWPGSDVRIQVRVPVGAVTGPIAVQTATGARSRRTRSVTILPPPPPTPNPTLTPVPGPREPGAPVIETGTSRTRAYYGARRAVVFSYRVDSGSPSSLQVQLIRARDGAAVKTWAQPPPARGQVQSIVWSGGLGTGPAAPGRYSFRVTAQGTNGATARSASTQDYQRDAFDLYDDIFPVRGRHGFGGAGSRFGAPRVGHRHQGQDVPARCGTRLVAARGGRVRWKAYQSAAGNYLVIDAAGTNVDYVYMHLAEPSPFMAGDRVYTGQRIGSVGATGDATGCHLHFELWRGRWYNGGRPFDPLPALLAWDRYS